MSSLLRRPTSRLSGTRVGTSVSPFLVTQNRTVSTQELDTAKGDRERVVILGSGWAGYTLSRRLDPTKYQVLVVSPRSYFVFTPLLASTAVGTLEFRNALEPIRRRGSLVELYQGWADEVDFRKKIVKVEENIASDSTLKRTSQESSNIGQPELPKGQVFDVSYDKLVVAVGCYNQTFGIKGVKENALFLKDVGDARKIRKRVLECFEKAALPTTTEEQKKRLLKFAVVGGGPTGIEYSAELHDLVKDDLSRLYPSLALYVRITVYDVAPTILSMFDSTLAKYAMDNFRRSGIEIKTEHHVEELRPGVPGVSPNNSDDANPYGSLVLKTKEEGEIGIGMCVWSTGLMMNPFIQHTLERTMELPPRSLIITQHKPNSADFSTSELSSWRIKKDSRTGGMVTDDQLRVKLADTSLRSLETADVVMKDVFALGDCGVTEKLTLPATAQVANQKAVWLAKRLNKGDGDNEAFTFKNLGVMAYIGNWRAIMQSGSDSEIKGRTAWILWRTAYLTMAVSWRNKILIPTYWFVNWVFGRDISRF